MNQLTKTVFSLALTVTASLPTQAQLVINELMQSNIDCIMDDLNDFPDSWVELYNTGDTPVSLQDYQLGKSSKASEAWQLPDKQVNARGHILVYCDKVGNGLHTDFRLESGKGCEVYLFRGSETVDRITGLKKQPAPNIAYGRKTDGADEWGYQQQPTPATSNCGQLCTDMLGDPVFSMTGRVLTTSQTIMLTLTLPKNSPQGTEIRYTTDGTEPTLQSPLYQSPLTFSTNTKVRAKLFLDGYLSPRSTTHSYIFFPSSRALTLPVVSIVTNHLYLDDSKIGIYTDSKTNGKYNYEYDWRRPVNIELFETANQPGVLNQLCETRIMGGATRGNALKSLAVYANKRFGEKRLEYEFFPDQRPGVTDFKSIALRNAGNDFDYLYLRDAIIQRTMAQHADLDWQSWRPVIVYINGTYKGILNIRDRSNEDNIYTYYDGLEDIDMFENWYELKEGTWDHYNQFKAFYAEHGHTMAEYEQWMDCREFINLMAMNLYYNNQDFPGNNIVMWRPRTDGGRWRWIAKDTDFGLGLYGSSATYKTLEWLHNPSYDNDRSWANQWEHTRLFRRLMEDADFKREFIDRTAIYMGDFLNERGTRAVWDPMYDIIKTEFPFHRSLYQYNQWWPSPYANEVCAVRTWLSNRTASFYQQLADYYQLGTPIPLTVNKAPSEAGVSVTMNGVPVVRQYFDGKFFQGRSLTLTGTAAEGREVQGWRVVLTTTDGTTVTNTISQPVYTFSMPACRSIAIEALIGEASGIEEIISPASADWQSRPYAVYDLRGRHVGTTVNGLPQGIYIVRQGSHSRKIAIK